MATMTATATTCSVCEQPIEGTPFGPIRSECCGECWMRAGSYKMVRIHAHGPWPGDEFNYPSEWTGEIEKGRVLWVDDLNRTVELRFGKQDDDVEEDVPWTDLRPC